MTLGLGDRAVLRQLAVSDAAELHALIEANRQHLRPWMPWADQDAASTTAFLQAARDQASAGDGVQFAVVEHGRIVGTAGFHRVDWRNAATSVGYWLAAEAQGRGLITRGVAAMLDHAFGPWELHRAEIRAAPRNARSRAVPVRLGFTEEGIARDAERHADRFGDLVVYSMLAPDWRQRAR